MKWIFLMLWVPSVFSAQIVFSNVNNVKVDGVPYGDYVNAYMNCPQHKEEIKVAMEKHLQVTSKKSPLEAEAELARIDQQLWIVRRAAGPSKADRKNVKDAADAARVRMVRQKADSMFKSNFLPN